MNRTYVFNIFYAMSQSKKIITKKQRSKPQIADVVLNVQ